MKYLLVNHNFVIISEDEEVEGKLDLIKMNDPNADIIVCKTLDESMSYARVSINKRGFK